MKLNLKWRIKLKLYDWRSKLGEYCNNNPGDEYAYNFYRFMEALVY